MAELFSPPKLLNSRRWSGLRVGILGGSFNPPHQGHIHLSHIAMQKLNLDAVWWLVTPQNPLKDKTSASAQDRLTLCRAMKKSPRIISTDIETAMGTDRTIKTLTRLKKNFPHTHFIWLSGSDIAREFHRWQRWRDIPHIVPMAIIGRPPAVELVRKTKLRSLALNQKSISTSLRNLPPPGTVCWIMEQPLQGSSSTALRNA